MGFMDFLFNKERAEERRLAKLKKTLTHMYVQAAERQYAIETLREMGTPEAVRVLLARFGVASQNTTTDADEKELVYAVLVDMNKIPDLDIPAIVIDWLKKAEEKVNWPLRVLTDLLTYEEMTQVVIDLLADCETGYQRNPEKKQELILRAAEFKSPELAEQIVRFLEDDNETIRFLAVDSALAQEEPELVREPLTRRLVEEESLRIVQKLGEVFSDRPEWKIDEEQRQEVEIALPDEYGIHKDGHVYRKRS
ncbi:MAG: hypothetical protein ACNA8W_03230 [Bradymonadaceae bacterium]